MWACSANGVCQPWRNLATQLGGYNEMALFQLMQLKVIISAMANENSAGNGSILGSMAWQNVSSKRKIMAKININKLMA